MLNNSIFVKVAVPVPLFETFIYKLDKKYLRNIPKEELIGRRVLIPFKDTKNIGIITEIDISLDDDIDFLIKDVESIPDKYPIFSKEYIEIIKDLSDFYVAPIGLSLYYCMPDTLRWKYIKSLNKWEKKGFNNYIVYAKTNNVDSLKLSQKQKEVLEYIISVGETTLEDLKELGYSPRTINTLIEKGFIEKENLFFLEEDITKAKLTLNQKIKSFGEDFLKKGAFLYSSEKIEKRIKTYINMIANNIYNGKSSLIIFPNISSLKQAYKFLKPIFGEKLYIYFDGLKSKDKLNTWFNLKNLDGLVCIGTFSSIFIPIKNLSLLVIEEEHSTAYKMMRTPRFDIRNFAYKIYQKFKNLTFILSSSVPSVETVYLLKKGLLKEFKKGNVLNSNTAKIHIKDFPILNLENELGKILKDKDNILILANRRGYSSFLYCERCEKEIYCERCDIPLKVYKKTKRLECPICNVKYKYIERCPECNNSLTEIGFGIEKIEMNLKKLFPRKNITFETTIIDKEILYKDYETVVNISPDIYLKNSGFKGEEKFLRSLVYPYLKSLKNYLIFTNEKENIVLKSLLNKNLNEFYKNELKKRKILGYPPFKSFILLIFEGENLTKPDVENLFNYWLESNNLKNIEYEGVYYAYFPYLRNRFRYHIILKNFKEKEKLKELYYMANKKGVKLIIDVSPKDIK